MSTPFNFSGGSNPFGSTSASTSSPFGQPATASSSAPATSIFSPASTGSTQPNSSTGGLFSNSNSTSTGTQKPLFGSLTGSTPSSGAPATTLFGASVGIPGSGAGTSTSKSDAIQSPSFFGAGAGGGFSFGSKKDDVSGSSAPASTSAQNTSGNSTPSQAGGLFGASSKPAGSNLFGNANTSALAGSTTPAPTKTGGTFSFANSTTPAAPPPSAGNPFGQLKPTESTSNPATSQPSGGPFGGKDPTSAGTSNLFGGSKPAVQPGSSLFGSSNPTKSATSASDNSIPTATSETSASKPLFGFGNKPADSTQPATNPGATASAPGNLFGGQSSTTSATSGATPAATSSLFGGNISKAPSATASATGGDLFAPKSTETGPASAKGTTAANTSGGLFAPKAAENGKNVAMGSSPENSTTASSGGTAGPLGASTAGPAPQLSRLKNKTMDEIITRWASDLSKYQKEFQDQAAKVAAWDRLLVDNGDKIQKLYNSTFEAERASAEVERQLTMVEGQQSEISEWLDRYEAEIDKMFAQQVGGADSMQAPDQERERTYKLAEKLTERLDEMGKDLAAMIQEINTASATLSQSNKPDDPLSQIVRVLNGHLSQLQWIDQNAASLQAKVTAAQKTGQSLGSNGRGNVENDPADDFYRSFIGRR
ncbi:MAG: FG-nucleoporin nsp1 [Claussenomyces sp. TS43310]|nr:MAG: FG-nucleoporin nsp1 [Claussenomyces sp. TS43310]